MSKTVREMFMDKFCTVNMDLNQYLAYQRGQLTLVEIKRINKDKDLINKGKDIIEKLLENKQVFKTATLITALILIVNEKCYALTANGSMERLQKIIDKVMEVVYIVQMVGFIVCLIMGLVEIIKAMINKDHSAIISICIRYVLGFSSLFIFPFLLRMVMDILTESLIW